MNLPCPDADLSCDPGLFQGVVYLRDELLPIKRFLHRVRCYLLI
jgi:hypothetical protein